MSDTTTQTLGSSAGVQLASSAGDPALGTTGVTLASSAGTDPAAQDAAETTEDTASSSDSTSTTSSDADTTNADLHADSTDEADADPTPPAAPIVAGDTGTVATGNETDGTETLTGAGEPSLHPAAHEAIGDLHAEVDAHADTNDNDSEQGAKDDLTASLNEAVTDSAIPAEHHESLKKTIVGLVEEYYADAEALKAKLADAVKSLF